MEDHYGFKPGYAPPPAYNYPAQPPNPAQMQNPGHPFPDPNQMHHVPNPTPTGQAYRWVDSSTSYGSVPPTAVQGGVDADGHAIFVGRAYHEGDLIPAKVIPGKNAAYVPHNGEEHEIEHYQILCKQILEWVPSHAGQVPPGAVQGGHTSGGEVLFVGRAFHEGSQTIGKVHPSHGVCYIPFDGEEIACPEYEILVLRI
ncbi:hypothetical protein Zmor_027338 [Zophobas morio]|uniref:Natterin-3 n=1 Tax=Zophobas morio TaxID=2755281 RepID=A0AA38HQE4_9CUCU|nr:hypothetical protein Zmor_027338 [Zophobas morio]